MSQIPIDLNRERKFYKNTFANISEDKRRHILETAIKEFADKGYNGTNINVVAKKAGISVGAMYKYFESKEDLFLMIIDICMQFLEDTLRRVMESDDSIMKKVERIFREIQKTSRESKDLICLYNEMTTIGNKDLVERVSRDIESISAKTYAELISKGQASGVIRQDIDPKLGAFFLDNLFMSLQFSYSCDYYMERFRTYCGDDIEEKDELVIEEMCKLVKSAFCPS
ncbi:MAG: TetR/AcrR family transcriptional regulator [Tissierellia bacterium]|nr:TetR/AcrR family transcriptional regulator [Tissierellia bacterium]